MTVYRKPALDDPRAKLQARIDGLEAWLRENHPEIGGQQKHLDAGSSERAYWHYGYLTALRDALNLLGGQRSDLN